MSALPPVEATEPDPAATSLPNDETVNKENGSSAAQESESKDAKMDADESVAESASKDSNGLTEVKKENGAKKGEHSPHTKRRHYDNKVNHSKYDPSVLEATDDHNKIRNQVEFYFSDHNLPGDTHMWKLTDGTSNNPVLVTEICKFGRMKRFQPYAAVVAALRDSHFLKVAGEEGEETVQRKEAYDPTVPRKKAEGRSIYAKGFGEEEPSSQFDIEAFFAPYGPTNAVRLRRADDKLFKGSVFVEFADEETAEKFLALDPKPLWKGKHELIFKSKTEYQSGKIQEIKDGVIEPQQTWASKNRGRGGNFRGRGRGRGGKDRDDRGHGRGDRRDRGDRDPDDWKKRREEDRASGFKDNRRDDFKGGNRQRGGRRGGRDDRGRDNDRNREREENNDKEVKEDNSESKNIEAAPAQNDKKRAREGDDGEDNPAKKVDTKTEVAADAS